MAGTDALAQRTLDELPANVAVVDAAGDIVVTNDSWESFGDAWGRATGDVGENYFDAASEAEDAVAGIRAVLAGDRDLYTYEYPCHTPDGRKWFVMRVTRFEHDGDPYAVVAHVDVTDRKLAELETQHLIERVDGLVSDVTAAVVAADTQDAVASGVVDAVASVPAYEAAWFARIARADDEMRVVASTEDGAQHGPWPLDGDSPQARALRERTVVVADGDVASVPLVAQDVEYGVLCVASGDPDVFDDRECRVLAAVGRTVATALRAVDSAAALSATNVVEFEVVTASDDLFVNRLSRALDCTLSFRGTVPDGGDRPLVFFEVGGATRDDVVAWAADDPGVSAASVVAELDDAVLVEFEAADEPFTGVLASRGVVTRDVTVTDGRSRIVMDLPADRNARDVVELLRERYGDADLVSYRQSERPQRSAREAWTDLDDRLTDRQRTALTKAYLSGFFEWPRPVTGDELADSMDISRSTFHQHLRAAERKLAATYLDDPN